MLYMRMLLLMVIGLYTTRVVLNALGVEDYGVYTVVGGMVGMLAFINTSMSQSTSRYLAFAIGKKDTDLLHRTFAMSLLIHLIIAVIIVILCETVGVWYLNTYMNVPEASRWAAMWVLQISIVGVFIGICMVPFSSAVVAHEDMKAFAWIGILNGALKLAVAFLLLAILMNKLILYALLHLGATIITLSVWISYCHQRYPLCRYRLIWDKALFKEMTGFTGWQFLSSFSWVLRNQGMTLLVNFFFGPVLNASRDLAMTVSGTIMGFVGNFQTAANPQIVKTYAADEIDAMHRLMMRSSKFSFLLLWILALPILLETKPLLVFWLKNPPEYTVIFAKLTVIAALADQLSGTMNMGAMATGRIRLYQLTVTLIMLSTIIWVWIGYMLGMAPQWMYVVEIGVCTLAFIARLIILRKLIGLNINIFLRKVTLPELFCVLVSFSVALVIWYWLPNTVSGVISCLAISFIIACASVLFLGMDKGERLWIINVIKSRLHFT